jgi:hypothetical protein
MGPQTETKSVDISRLNRKERRNIGRQAKGKLMGRNMPYQKNLHHSVELFNKLRADEIEEETHANTPPKESS